MFVNSDECNFLILISQCGDKKFEDIKRWTLTSGWESKGVWGSRAYSHKSWGKSTDTFNIGKLIHLKHEYRGKFLDISGWTSGKFSCLGQVTDREGLFQFREIFWETFHESFSCHAFKSNDRYINKILMNKLRESLFWKSTDSWDNNIIVSVRIDPDNFELKTVKIVASLVGWSPRMTLRVNKVTMFKRFRCNLLKTNINLREPDDIVLEGWHGQ